MLEKVLFVDGEKNAPKSMERVFVDADMTFINAGSAKEALKLLVESEIGVLAKNNILPGMSGVEPLSCLGDLSPETVKILMTGHADLPTSLDAINIGEVFRFIVKSWEKGELGKVARDEVDHYRLDNSMGGDDEAKLLSLAQAIELKDPYTRGHCDRVAGFALMMAERLGMDEESRQHIKYGSSLHDCGKIGFPDALLNSSGKLNDSEFATIRKHPVWGARVARQARLPRKVINIILYHHERYDGEGYPCGLSGETIPLEARIVTIADVFDAMTSKRPYRDPLPRKETLEMMNAMSGHQLDPELMRIFYDALLEGFANELCGT